MIHMRDYNERETKNIKFLVSCEIDHRTMQITATGLKKSILDATAPVRNYFKVNGIHDYDQQQQGIENKVLVETYILTEDKCYKTQTSLYRPETKSGDPRMWINKIRGFEFFDADDIFALIAKDRKLFVINLTQIDIINACSFFADSPLVSFIDSFQKYENTASEELLGLIKEYMFDWQPTDVDADTAVGRAIETILGIPMNSSKEPDYKGIELKSSRKNKDRNTLFSQVPDLGLSRCKTSKEIVAKYGYIPEGQTQKTLHVTVSARKPNPQGLGLKVNEANGLLEIDEFRLLSGVNDIFEKLNDVVVWKLALLHERLLTKHKETFWLNVETEKRKGIEYFRCRNIIHTKNPMTGQFDILLAQGQITVDLLLCRSGGHGDTFGFKIQPNSKSLLFPQAEEIIL